RRDLAVDERGGQGELAAELALQPVRGVGVVDRAGGGLDVDGDLDRGDVVDGDRRARLQLAQGRQRRMRAEAAWPGLDRRRGRRQRVPLAERRGAVGEVALL